MNVERLHAIALSVRADLDQTGTVAAMAALRDALRNSIASPQEPSHQEAVSTGLQTLLDAVASAPSNEFPPLWVEALEELGISELLGDELAGRLRSIFERNQITPSVAADEVDAIATELSDLDAGLSQLLAGLAHFELGSEDLDPGQAELGVLIPRPAVREELELLGNEFVELQRLLGPVPRDCDWIAPSAEGADHLIKRLRCVPRYGPAGCSVRRRGGRASRCALQAAS